MAPEKDLEDVNDDAPGGIQVEVIPEAEDDKPRLKGDTRALDVRDEEIQDYGKGVQDRIKKLRFAFHEERRLREQAQRDSVSAQDFAQRVHRENQELKKNVTRGEQAVIHQALSRVTAEIEQAKSSSKAAYESGQADEIVASNERLARAVAEKERLALLKDAPEPEEKPAPPPQPQQPQQDERTRQWLSRNPWWDKPGEEERTAFTIGVDKKLRAQGVNPNVNPDLYWKTMDERLAAVFPENANGNGHEPDEDRQRTVSRPLAVAGGTRANAGGATAARTKVIRLSESEVRVAHRLGLTPEQYAQQLVIEEAARNGR